MKKIMMMLLGVAGAALAHAQTVKSTDLPAVVKAEFLKKFPEAKGVKWSKESDTEFEAEFTSAGNEIAANFDQAGKWILTETDIDQKSLPKPVLSVLAKDYATLKIVEAEKAETPTSTFYEVELKDKTVIQFSADGKILKTEKETKEKD
jgi:hypothetical protein